MLPSWLMSMSTSSVHWMLSSWRWLMSISESAMLRWPNRCITIISFTFTQQLFFVIAATRTHVMKDTACGVCVTSTSLITESLHACEFIKAIIVAPALFTDSFAAYERSAIVVALARFSEVQPTAAVMRATRGSDAHVVVIYAASHTQVRFRNRVERALVTPTHARNAGVRRALVGWSAWVTLHF